MNEELGSYTIDPEDNYYTGESNFEKYKKLYFEYVKTVSERTSESKESKEWPVFAKLVVGVIAMLVVFLCFSKPISRGLYGQPTDVKDLVEAVTIEDAAENFFKAMALSDNDAMMNCLYSEAMLKATLAMNNITYDELKEICRQEFAGVNPSYRKVEISNHDYYSTMELDMLNKSYILKSGMSANIEALCVCNMSVQISYGDDWRDVSWEMVFYQTDGIWYMLYGFKFD